MQKLLGILVVISCVFVGIGSMTTAEADSKIAFSSLRDGIPPPVPIGCMATWAQSI